MTSFMSTPRTDFRVRLSAPPYNGRLTGNLSAHYVAQFLPWHRWFGHAYHTQLRRACGYRGPLVYWVRAVESQRDLSPTRVSLQDWSLDHLDPTAAPVWSSDSKVKTVSRSSSRGCTLSVFSWDQTGFGTNGVGPSVNEHFGNVIHCSFTRNELTCSVSTAAGAVQDGAFANITLLWPEPHRLTRRFRKPFDSEYGYVRELRFASGRK